MAPTTHSSDHSSIPPTSNPTPSSSCPQVLLSVQKVSLDYEPDNAPIPQDDEDSIPNLAEAITLMTHEPKHHDSTPMLRNLTLSMAPILRNSTTSSFCATFTSETILPTLTMKLKSLLPYLIFVVLHLIILNQH